MRRSSHSCGLWPPVPRCQASCWTLHSDMQVAWLGEGPPLGAPFPLGSVQLTIAFFEARATKHQRSFRTQPITTSALQGCRAAWARQLETPSHVLCDLLAEVWPPAQRPGAELCLITASSPRHSRSYAAARRNKRRILGALAAGAAGTAAAYYVYKRWTWEADDDAPSTSGAAAGAAAGETLIEPRGTATTARMVGLPGPGTPVAGGCCVLRVAGRAHWAHASSVVQLQSVRVWAPQCQR